MNKQSLIFFFLSLVLASCGAANNSDREDEDPGPRGTDNAPDNRPITAADIRDVVNSHIFRDLGTKVFSHSKVTDHFKSNTLPASLNPIPDEHAHNMDARTTGPKEAQDCGRTIEAETVTIQARIDDCDQKNQGNNLAHTWSGHDLGMSGEGRWELVSYSSIPDEKDKSVWRDLSTGLLWSPPLPEKSWDYASGNVSEPEQICNGANDTANKDYFLGIQADEVIWRLPTRNDYLQADLNGARFVLSSPDDTRIFWTANIANDAEAWVIQQRTGILSKLNQNSPAAIRCVGHVIK